MTIPRSRAPGARPALLAALALALSGTAPASGARPKGAASGAAETAASPREGDPIKTLLEFDSIPAVHDPHLVSRENADRIMDDHELVVGVVGEDGVARAYATVALDHHEIINDWVGRTPIGVTW